MRKLILLAVAALGFSASVPAQQSRQPEPFVPVFRTNFPDPFILPAGNEFLAYATNPEGHQANVQMARSTNLVDWEFVRNGGRLHDAMPDLPPWAHEGWTWAPEVLRHGDAYLLYFTAKERRSQLQCVGVARSPNLVDWEFVRNGGRLHDAMPDLPPWAREGWTWAPEVLRHGDGYLLYFTAKERRSQLQCVGVARSANPRGPFVSQATEPLVCQRETGGTIDPHVFRDTDGQLYLYYKNDGNHPDFRRPTDIFGQRLSADGMSLSGQPVALLRNDAPWEAHVIESPTMVRRGNGYVMFFSANHFGWEEHQRLSPYAMGYARCRGPMGPCTDSPENPILYSYNDRQAGCLSGPGHQALFEHGGRQFIVFHAHGATRGCRRAQLGRYMYVAPLIWNGDTPRLGVSLRPRPPAGQRN